MKGFEKLQWYMSKTVPIPFHPAKPIVAAPAPINFPASAIIIR